MSSVLAVLTLAWVAVTVTVAVGLVRRWARVDTWAACPVPAALVDGRGVVVGATGPEPATPWAELLPAAGLPPAGHTTRLVTSTGANLAATGVRGGALVLAVDPDPVTTRRTHLLATGLARLAHDLASPLSTTQASLAAVAPDPANPAAGLALATARAELVRLTALVRASLELTTAYLDPGPRQVVRAAALLEDAAVGIPTADTDRLPLAVHLPAEDVRVRVNPGELVRVLRNLTLNALRHTTSPGSSEQPVLLAAHADGASVTFSVTDSGAGFDLAALEAAGHQVHPRDARPGAGSGLGLAICREILATHATALHAEPTGAGFRIGFTLPRAQRP